MASESETTEMRSQSRDLSSFIPFLLGFTITDPSQIQPEPEPTRPDLEHNSENQSSPDDRHHHQRDRIIIINPFTQGMMVIEGTGLDHLLRGVQGKDEHPPASRSSIEAMPSVDIREEDDGGECVICLDEWGPGEVVKEMPCNHRFHGGCIEKWLGVHGSCPVCRFKMPVEGDKREEREGGERRRAEREIWVSFTFGSHRRRTEDEDSVNVNQSNSSDSSDHLAFEEGNQMGN